MKKFTPLASKESNSEIQFEKSADSKNKGMPWIRSHSIEFSLVITGIVSLFCELYFGWGTYALIVSLIISLLCEFSSRQHDNIPMMSCYYPFIGNYFWIKKYFDRFYDQQCQEFKDYSKNYNNGKPVPLMATSVPKRSIIVIADPVLVDIVFRKQFGNAIKASSQYEFIRPLLGHGIFASNGAVWKRHRAIASRMFTTRSLRDFMFKNFLETTDKLMLKCEELMKINSNIDMYDMFLRLTFEAFTNSAFGIDVDAIGVAPDVVPFANAFDRTLEITAMRFTELPLIWKMKRLLNIGVEKELKQHCVLMEAFIKNVISKRKEFFATIEDKYQSSTTSNERMELRKKYDLLSMFIKDNPTINEKELRDITMNFIIAGRDTTAQTLAWFMYEMTKTDSNGNKVNGEIEEKIRREIEDVLGNNDTSYETMNKLKYLECAFLETLRLHPSVPNLVRRAVSDYNFGEITGDYEKYNYTIHKGEEIIVAAYTMGRLEWNWDDALSFKPERFWDDKNKKITDYSPSLYPAFNLNPRLCLGKNLALLEAKICIVKLFKKYKNIKMNPNKQDIIYTMAATNHLKNGLRLSLQ